MRSDNNRSNRHHRHSKTPVMLYVDIALLCVLIIIIPLGEWICEEAALYKTCAVEAGTVLEAVDFTRNADPDAFFKDGSTEITTDEAGEFAVKIKNGFFTHKVTLVVEDTVAPTAEAVDVDIEYGETCAPEDFVTDIQDATAVTVQYVEEPDMEQYGSQEVDICLTDGGGNTLNLSAALYISPVYLEITQEIGTDEVEAQAFAVSGVTVTSAEGLDLVDYSTAGDYTVTLSVDGAEYSSVLHVVDTVAPVVTTRDLEGYPVYDRKAEEFVEEIVDATEVTVEYAGDPDLMMLGTQELTLVFTDACGNVTEATATLTNMEDTEAPVINGAEDLTVYVGGSVAYMDGVTVTDNSGDEDIPLSVDNSQVDLNEIGTYELVYYATDASGNETSETVTVTVEYKKYSEQAVYALANDVLDEILTDDMTDYEKVYAIYYYTYHHIAYVGTSEKGDWLKAAYEGITEGKGDCWTYASTAQALFNAAGIKNMMISKIPTATSSHTWTLVDIGDGWYHVDCTPRKDHPTIFMWTDEELMEYSNSHNLSHNYDHSAYPETN